MDYRGYYYYIPASFYDSEEMKLIGYQPNGNSASVLVHALAGIHTRSVADNGDGTFSVTTDDGTFTDAETMDILASCGYRTNPSKLARDLELIAKFPPFDYLAYSDEERDEKDREGYQ